jgi:tetratricopeptide (TPR) repeat protein
MYFKNWIRELIANSPRLVLRAPGRGLSLRWIGLWLAVSSLMPVYAQTVTACGSLSQGSGGYGPYDYRTDKSKLAIVEQYHFTPPVEALIRGSSNVLPGGDLDYTLRAFPNHHRALMAMLRYGEKMKSPQPPGTRYSVACYFDRALRFRPDDTLVRLLYATLLSKSARTADAMQQLELATVSAADNAFTHYNIGMVYFDLKSYDKALLQAHKAMSLGFPQTQLRERLQGVGKWTEPTELSKAPAANDAQAEQTK